jgi:hypothetical protein
MKDVVKPGDSRLFCSATDDISLKVNSSLGQAIKATMDWFVDFALNERGHQHINITFLAMTCFISV